MNSLSRADDNGELDVMLAAFLGQLDRGERPDPMHLLESFPQYRAEILAFLEDFAILGETLAVPGALSNRTSWPKAWGDHTLAAFQGLVERALCDPDKSQSIQQAAATVSDRFAKSRRVGNFKLLERIGQGGMGEVWMADQERPVKRRVALKLIKAGLDEKLIFARFEAERQALALMDHPAIARILDAGVSDDGRPWFAMELVKGIPLVEYCDERRLPIQSRLELFIQVCAAAQHAHQKGVIHRDLKPSNILVTEHDGHPQVKVIDFGLAKALAGTTVLTDHTLHTAYGAVAGTPIYMAPEQVAINALDIDTRVDVYALGVILYELLTGTTPLERQRVKEIAWDEVRRHIREVDPPRPSARLSSTNTLPALAATRQIEPIRLVGLVRGDLDWITLRSLEKDRNRRYSSASELAADVRRYLQDEAVTAAPPGLRYRVRKFVRKHRLLVTVARSLLADSSLSNLDPLIGSDRIQSIGHRQHQVH